MAGRRTRSPGLVVHLGHDSAAAQPRVGVIVGKIVGDAVTRNRVRRQLRHLARPALSALPGSAVVVLRATPPAAQLSFEQLGESMRGALERVLSAR